MHVHHILYKIMIQLYNIILLNCYSHNGYISYAINLFNNIPKYYKTREVYAAMIDVFSRSRKLKIAFKLIQKLEKQYNIKYHVLWMTLLSGCKTFNNIKLA